MSPGRSYRLSLAAAALVIALVGSACGVWAGLGDREEWAESIRDAAGLARERGGATVVVTIGLEEIETILREPPELLMTRLEGPVRFGDSIDEPTGDPDASVLAIREPEEPAGASLVYDDFVLALPRDLERGGLPWAVYDFDVEPEEDFDVEDRRLSVGFNPFSPAVLLQLLEGVLTGSVERLDGVAPDPGVEVYAANFSNDAALREIDEFRGEAIIRMFRAIGFGGEVFPGEVWLDEEGLPRRVSFVIEQRQDRLNLFEMTVTIELMAFGPPPEIQLPAAAQRQEVERFSELMIEFLRRAE